MTHWYAIVGYCWLGILVTVVVILLVATRPREPRRIKVYETINGHDGVNTDRVTQVIR